MTTTTKEATVATFFLVYHAKTAQDSRGRVTGVKGRFGFEPTVFPDDYQLVATVECDQMGRVFDLTNHIDHAWPENPEVIVAPDVNPAHLRSTSVGDVIAGADGTFVIAPIGFQPLPMQSGATVTVPAGY